jgi:hypothetical protein
VKHFKIGLNKERLEIPGLENLSEDQKIACLAMGTIDQATALGMVGRLNDEPCLTPGGRVHFDRLLLKMKAVPPEDRIFKSLKSTGLKLSEDESRKVAATVHKILNMGIIEAFHDYRSFCERRKSHPEVGAGQPEHPQAAPDEAGRPPNA